MYVGQDAAMEQATPLIQGTIIHVQLATEAAADPQVVSSEGAPGCVLLLTSEPMKSLGWLGDPCLLLTCSLRSNEVPANKGQTRIYPSRLAPSSCRRAVPFALECSPRARSYMPCSADTCIMGPAYWSGCGSEQPARSAAVAAIRCTRAQSCAHAALGAGPTCAGDAPEDDPSISAATSSPPLPSDRTIPRMPSFPDIPTYQQHSLPRPVSAESNFSAAASSPSTYMTQVGPIDGHGSLKPGSMRLVTTGLRTSTALAEPLFAGQDVQRSLRSRGVGESTTGTGQGTAPESTSPRQHGRILRSRSGTTSVKDEEMQEAGPDSPGVFRSLRRRPQPNYAQAAGESESDATSASKSEEDRRNSAEQKKSQRGRKRRTEPIVVEREDGTKEEVSPQVYRRLRRRVTNRLSARRMRQKRAEERETIAAETQKLQQENAELRARMAELEGANRALAREAYGWRSRCEQPAGQPLGSTQQQQQLGAPARLLSPFPTPNPTAEKRAQSLPVPQQGAPEAPQQVRSMSPGGFDSFTLAAEYPSLHMLSPLSQQTPLFNRHQQPSAAGVQHTPLSLQSFEGPMGAQSRQLSTGSPAAMAYYASMAGLQPGASPSELQSTPEHEQLRSGQAGVQYGSHLHLRSSPYSISELQRLPPHHRREGGPSLMSPRHFSAPNLSQGSMDLYQQRSHLPSDNPALASSAFGQQGGLEARGSFGVEASGSYGQPGLQARASYGQQSSPRSLQFARAPGAASGEEEQKRSSAPAALQQAQEAFGMAFRDGVPSSPPRQLSQWALPPGSGRE
ncbi:hypothetical protein WJX75_006718 [Coccomyxa subellipsoidea]|uniref:BZIP domain-containing protein n=1 Tax=Coccomyxa subellipsoidea TaxID=248742 RepID=A0ABR2YKP9_9CHLO